MVVKKKPVRSLAVGYVPPNTKCDVIATPQQTHGFVSRSSSR
jgi:hypothetical protein